MKNNKSLGKNLQDILNEQEPISIADTAYGPSTDGDMINNSLLTPCKQINSALKTLKEQKAYLSPRFPLSSPWIDKKCIVIPINETPEERSKRLNNELQGCF